MLNRTYSILFAIALLSGIAIAALAEESRVEPAALETAGIRQLQQDNPDLDGYGVVIAAICRSTRYINGRPQNDYRFNMNHQSLADADVLFDDRSDGRHGVSAHATAIAGVLLGLDPHAALPDATAFAYRGACPSVSMDVYEFWRFAALWLFARKPIPADIITLSLGDVFEGWWTRGIEQLADEKGVVVVASAGNGQAARDPLLYPAAGANVIGVGVMPSATEESGTASLSRFETPTAAQSSIGPTDDFRAKPDIVAPGTAIVPDAVSRQGYTTVANASSLAAPLVTGAAALLLQKAVVDKALQTALNESPVNCVIKAVLMNSARKLPGWQKGVIAEEDHLLSPLDRIQGAGALDAQAAMAQLTAGRQPVGDVKAIGWDGGAIALEQELLYHFRTHKPNTVFTATLTWNRHFEERYPFRLKTEQSNLRLELWGVNPQNTDELILLDVSDSPCDTVEHLWLPLPEGFSQFAIAVRFAPDAAKPAPPYERFALAWSAK